MAINLVRKPSETPNVNNYDDYRLFRYATGGYNGVVEKYGNECDYQINGNTFKIKSGEIIIDGIQSKIDASGVEIIVDNITGVEYYTVYCEVNLSLIDNQKTEIKSIKSTVTYPEIDKGDDLTENQSGIARLELYKFTVTNGVINLVTITKLFNLIVPYQQSLAELDNKFSGESITIFGNYIFPKLKLLTSSSVSWGQSSDGGTYRTVFSDNKSLFGRKFYINFNLYSGILDFKNTSYVRVQATSNFNPTLKIFGYGEITFFADNNILKIMPISKAFNVESATTYGTTLTTAGTFYALYEIID